MTRLIDERVLEPIAGAKPAGEDLRGLRDWVALRAARPKPEETADLREWAPANPVKTDWVTYRDMVETALCTRSKDLELGIFFTEACARVFGFEGLRDGLWTIHGLITQFRDKGLFPTPEDGDLEAQYGKLDWLNEKLSEVLREIPLTMRPEPEVNYSLNYRDESLRANGMISGAEFEAAVAAGSTEQYETMAAALADAASELSAVEGVVNSAYGESALSFTQAKQTLAECRSAVGSIVQKRRPNTSQDTLAPLGSKTVGAGPHGIRALPTSGTRASDSWSEAEQLARSGDVDRALSSMAALASEEPNGRVRFQRKLLLADLCLQTRRQHLAKSILEELHELVETHRLDAWETSEMIGAVWSRLVRCYRDKEAGTADEQKEAEFFLKLSRLDPWQALTCGEPLGRR